ncbi:MAG: hypothetical protein A3D67_03270 [Candidatus Lloydbacteria bacterium RIFCSPHIGHO2_02_FULL_51_22]|uniref:Uncharacterized protein n=2 Tax=Candidatus Lloydiibacteriota TaxID=1817910 RepID=A0A1G2D9C1_9BACT|nr:MAG: hypothetical protein A3D67_03270 [Candidatus Lloydbacteria bacterium RIFCSPHIGHO2_02_FULL_51_22]OGZ14340.1 MAG: hypothetical protein A3J08_02160 [Candidatus Lloydbacteria bacterium RIFCSPLOWO2_02_FULL_51_11]
MKNGMKRLCANAGIFLSLLLFPWWVTLILAIASVFLIGDFYELALWAYAGDTLYGTDASRMFHSVLLIGGVAFFVFLVERAKKMTRFY